MQTVPMDSHERQAKLDELAQLRRSETAEQWTSADDLNVGPGLGAPFPVPDVDPVEVARVRRIAELETELGLGSSD